MTWGPAGELGAANHGWPCGLFTGCSGAFGIDAQLIKIYGLTIDVAGPEWSYIFGECFGIGKQRLLEKQIKALISTFYAEKQNQTMRQHMKYCSPPHRWPFKEIDNH